MTVKRFYVKDQTYRDLLNLCDTKSSSHPNLSSAERTALSTLKNNNLLVIKQADKGGSLVIQDKIDYEKEAHCLLSDRKTYDILKRDPLPEFQVELKSLVEKAAVDEVLCKKEKQFLLPYTRSTPYFYHLPKIHKSTTCPPGRPIVASTDSFTSGLSHYIDFFLQPIISGLPSYIRDSGHVIETLQNYKWETDYLWASLDVVSLYTSMPNF